MIANVLPAQFMMDQPTAPLAPVTDDERALLRQLGEQCQQVLAEHGLGRVMMDGGVMPPRFESLSISDDSRWATIQLDVSPASLPGKGAMNKAVGRPLLNDLSGRTGFPWAAVNHVGITYAISLEQQQHRPMPQTVDLDSTLRPGVRAKRSSWPWVVMRFTKPDELLRVLCVRPQPAWFGTALVEDR